MFMSVLPLTSVSGEALDLCFSTGVFSIRLSFQIAFEQDLERQQQIDAELADTQFKELEDALALERHNRLGIQADLEAQTKVRLWVSTKNCMSVPRCGLRLAMTINDFVLYVHRSSCYCGMMQCEPSTHTQVMQRDSRPN